MPCLCAAKSVRSTTLRYTFVPLLSLPPSLSCNRLGCSRVRPSVRRAVQGSCLKDCLTCCLCPCCAILQVSAPSLPATSATVLGRRVVARSSRSLARVTLSHMCCLACAGGSRGGRAWCCLAAGRPDHGLIVLSKPPVFFSQPMASLPL
jgi:hypothetical protein